MMHPFLLDVAAGDKFPLVPVLAGAGALIVLVVLFILPKVLKKDDDNDDE